MSLKFTWSENILICDVMHLRTFVPKINFAIVVRLKLVPN